MNYKDFSYCENMTSSHVKIIWYLHNFCEDIIDFIPATKPLPKLIVKGTYFVSRWSKHLRRLLGNIRQPSLIFSVDIFGNFRKMIGNVRMTSDVRLLELVCSFMWLDSIRLYLHVLHQPELKYRHLRVDHFPPKPNLIFIVIELS